MLSFGRNRKLILTGPATDAIHSACCTEQSPVWDSVAAAGTDETRVNLRMFFLRVNPDLSADFALVSVSKLVAGNQFERPMTAGRAEDGISLKDGFIAS